MRRRIWRPRPSDSGLARGRVPTVEWAFAGGSALLGIALLVAARTVSQTSHDVGHLVVDASGSSAYRLAADGSVVPVDLPSPLSVRLVAPPLAERDYKLHLQEGGIQRWETVVEGSTLTLEGRAYRMGAVRRWTGILPDPLGDPMVSVALRIGGNPWSQQIPIGRLREVRTEGGTVLTLDYAPTGPPPLSAAPAPRQTEEPRWGIIEGETVHWLTTFIPGTGTVLADGRAVTLIEGAPGAPAIVVEVSDRTGVRRIRVPAGVEAEGLVTYPLSGGEVRRVRLYLQRDGSATVRVSLGRAFAEERELEEGETWLVPGEPLRLHLSAACLSAVPVEESQSPFHELPLEAGDEALFVREGGRSRLGPWLAQLVPVVDTSDGVAVVDVRELVWGGETKVGVQDARVGRYRLRLGDALGVPQRTALFDAANVDEDDAVILHVRVVSPRLAGLLLGMAGMLGLCLAGLQALRLLGRRLACALG